MTHDQTQFLARASELLFGGAMKRSQKKGILAICDSWWKNHARGDLHHLAYILATAYHETGKRMQPVRETFAGSDAAAIAILDRAYAAGRLPSVKTPYWRCDGDGKSWLGRGFVQLTHKRNYVAMSAITGIDLVADPDEAMETGVAAAILVEGMMRGTFTGRKCADYFGPGREDWAGARRIVNGTDRAETIAGYGRLFHAALQGD